MSGLFYPQKCSRYIKGFFKLHMVTNRRHSDYHMRRFIAENTQISGEDSLTPEIKLRLFTPECRFWRERAELWPLDDPYWAIYWPGGQALSRYVLDNPGVCRGRGVLDLGSGCGASAIAAKLSGAARVVANDIDAGHFLAIRGKQTEQHLMETCSVTYRYLHLDMTEVRISLKGPPDAVASIAIHMNSELNGVEPPACVTDNMIGSEPEGFDLILLGDMFYDEALATSLHGWLDRCIRTHGTKVLIGDPGRAQFEGHGIRRLLQHLAQFELPQGVKEENYGLTCSSVWLYQPDL